MPFSSVSFLYYFLPVVLAVYFAVPRQLKNFILLLASILIYFLGGPVYCLLILFAALSGYCHGLWMDRARNSSKLALASAVAFSLGPWLFFKCTDIFSANSIYYFRTDTLAGIILPPGMGIYTLQVLSYVFDLYRGRVEAQRSFLDFAVYVCLFPQLTAGPVVQYGTVEAELSRRSHSLEGLAAGVRRFILGLSKKVLLANTLAELSFIFQNAEQPTVLFYWLSAIVLTLQIYYELSGYSDMALGLGRMFGFHFPENFKYPLAAESITQFLNRWLVSLGVWFREYVYNPLEGRGGSNLKQAGLLLAAGLFFGLWHGSVIWGLALAALVILEKLLSSKLLVKLPKPARHLYVLILIVPSFVLLGANTIQSGAESLKAMLGLLPLPWSSPETVYYLRSYLTVLLVAALGTTPILAQIILTIRRSKGGAQVINLLEPLVLIILLLVVSAYLVEGSFAPLASLSI